MKKILLVLSIGVSCSHASVSVTANVRGFQDENGVALTDGTVGLLVIDTGNDGFGAVKEGFFQIGSTLGNDDFIDDDNDLIYNIVASTTSGPGGSRLFAGDGANIALTDSIPAGVASTGDRFAVYWFNITAGSVSVIAGDRYGIATDDTWILPEDGEPLPGDTVSTIVLSGAAAVASLTVQAIPEPSSIALLGLGAFGLIARRRRD